MMLNEALAGLERLGLELSDDGYSLLTVCDGDVDGEGRHIIVGGETVVTFADSEAGEKVRETILAALSPDGTNASETGDVVERVAVYREIFDEITLKAQPLCEDESDPERVTGYRLPVGPIHRACGKTGHHMLGVAQNVERSIRWLEASTDAVTFLNDYKLSEGTKSQIEEIEHHIATAVDRIRLSGWPNYPEAAIASTRADETVRLLREARTVLSVILDVAADFTETDRENCAHAAALVSRIDAALNGRPG